MTPTSTTGSRGLGGAFASTVLYPDANDAITGAGSESPEQAQASLRAYFVGHPQEYSDLRGIAQPLIDLRNSCPQNVSGAQLAALLGAFTSP